MSHKPNPHFRPSAQPLEDIAAEAIRQLMERGEWDNIEGKGKLLKIKGDLADAATMSAKLRTDAGFSTPWSDLSKEIESGLEEARRMIARSHKFYEAALRDGFTAKAEQQWSDALSNFDKQLAALNSKILKFNLLIPPQMPQLHKPRLRREKILVELGLTPQGDDGLSTE